MTWIQNELVALQQCTECGDHRGVVVGDDVPIVLQGENEGSDVVREPESGDGGSVWRDDTTSGNDEGW